VLDLKEYCEGSENVLLADAGKCIGIKSVAKAGS
jgi:hypothetical protein